MKSPRNNILLSLLCVVLAMPVGMAISSLLSTHLSITADSPYGITVSYVVMFGFVVAISLFLPALTRPEMERFNPLYVLWGFATILLWNCSVSPLAEFLPDFGSEQLDAISGSGWLSVLTAVLIAPCMEEWIFRGVFAGNLKRVIGPLWAVAVSAAIFAISHIYPLQVLTAFGAGLVLGAFYLITRSVVATILMHVIYNSFIYFIYTILPTESDDILVDLVPSEYIRTVIWILSFVLFLVSSKAIFRRLRKV